MPPSASNKPIQTGDKVKITGLITFKGETADGTVEGFITYPEIPGVAPSSAGAAATPKELLPKEDDEE
jgi:hypothetical protein